MKLNPDCIRDILLSVEEVTAVDVLFEYNRDERGGTRLGRYDHDEIRYHIRQCERSGLITGYLEFEAGAYIKIHDLEPAGHEFLANIRPDSHWESVKRMAETIGTYSLKALLQIAQGLVEKLVEAALSGS